ncbi:MAG TPA: hypothetical protein VGK71_09715, partial [Nitrospirota bacterium]
GADNTPDFAAAYPGETDEAEEETAAPEEEVYCAEEICEEPTPEVVSPEEAPVVAEAVGMEFEDEPAPPAQAAETEAAIFGKANGSEPAPAPVVVESVEMRNSRQVFVLPVRLTTFDGVKEVSMKISVEVELFGVGLDSITSVELLQPQQKEPPNPVPSIFMEEEPPKTFDDAIELAAQRAVERSQERSQERTTERSKVTALPLPKPKIHNEKKSVFQKILGM